MHKLYVDVCGCCWTGAEWEWIRWRKGFCTGIHLSTGVDRVAMCNGFNFVTDCDLHPADYEAGAGQPADYEAGASRPADYWLVLADSDECLVLT